MSASSFCLLDNHLRELCTGNKRDTFERVGRTVYREIFAPFYFTLFISGLIRLGEIQCLNYISFYRI